MAEGTTEHQKTEQEPGLKKGVKGTSRGGIGSGKALIIAYFEVGNRGRVDMLQVGSG